MKEMIPPLSFGTFIAYLLPGFIAFYSGTYMSTTLQTILNAALLKDSQIGPISLILILSCIGGVTISVIRTLILDPCQEKLFSINTDLDYDRLKDSETLNVFEKTIENKYRFAQFAGNICIALVIFIIVAYPIGPLSPKTQFWPLILIIVTAILLFLYHGVQLKSTFDTLSDVLKPQTKEA